MVQDKDQIQEIKFEVCLANEQIKLPSALLFNRISKSMLEYSSPSY